MSNEEPKRTQLTTSDPTVLRALAHPLRVALMRELDDHGEATATELAQRVGDTASNCSFHLRQLAKAGFIERVEARGTSRPWRAAHQGRDLRPDPNNAESVRAAGAIGAMYVQQEAARVVEFLTVRQERYPEWLDALTVNTSSFWATADEVREFTEHIHKLADRFSGRSKDESLRPDGAREVRFFATVNADPDSQPFESEA